MDVPERPVQLRGSAAARALLRWAGWQVRFDGLPSRQGVAIVYPHTSNWDFVVGVLAKWSVGIQVTFWGKASLFGVPLFGRWLRWQGGRPVDRHAPRGIVGQMTEELKAAKRDGRFMWLALSPEGTRRLTDNWRSGFYHVALAAQVPLALVYFDFAERVVGVEKFIRLSGDAAADMACIAEHLAHRVGKRPQLAAPVKWKT
ncbi:1-acyl-sn-glycerol-3-phosphate acyltransferase [Burkholderiaceae bacterium]|nr:1-acyl-sn-glycerol-3-phosphate acyltransferase [Burkholderiaceae bacterium]